MLRISVLLGAAALTGCAPYSPEFGNPHLVRLRAASLEEVTAHARDVQKASGAGMSDRQIIEKAMLAVANTLKDPESARFRGVTIRRFSDHRIVCGEVNAKNSYGGYVGYSRFAAGPDAATLEKKDDGYYEVQRASNFGLDKACGSDMDPKSEPPPPTRLSS